MRNLSRPALHWARLLLQQSSAPSGPAAAVAAGVARRSQSSFAELSKAWGTGQRGIHSGGFSCFAKEKETGDKDGEDEESEEKPAKGRRKIVEISDEEIASEPMDYVFSGVPPDFKAPRLSDEVKERMWKAHCDSPGPEIVDKLAERFNIRKQRVHAILWLKEIEKREEAQRGAPLEDDIERSFEQIHGAYDQADNERHYTLPRTMPDFEVQSEGWQGVVKAEGQSIDEASAKEEKMMVEEFEHRMAFNKMQISGAIKTDKLSRRRPAEGWSYLIEELGEAGKRGRRGGRRFVAQPDGSHRGLNDLEKMFLKRETVRPRRRLTPK